MRDRGIIYAGLAVFLGADDFPALVQPGGRAPRTRDRSLSFLPSKSSVSLRSKYMRNSHMDLLIQWREQAVRQGDKHFTAFNGKSYTIALVGTCLQLPHETRSNSATGATTMPRSR